MSGPKFQTMRQPLHLHIDHSLYDGNISTSSDPPSSSSSSAVASAGTFDTSDGGGGDLAISVLCMYDYQSDDPDQLSFSKNEILDVVKQEDTGWWAAIRKHGDVIGWIPQAFVRPITDDMLERLRNVRQELRVYEYEAEQLYNSAPISRLQHSYDETKIIPRPREQRVSGDSLKPPHSHSVLNNRSSPSQPHANVASRDKSSVEPWPHAPPSPLTPVPQPPLQTNEQIPSQSGVILFPSLRRRPARVDNVSTTPRPDVRGATGDPEAHLYRPRGEKMKRNVSHDLPWHLRPKYADQLELDNEGRIRKGTLNALVERLLLDPSTNDPIKLAEDTTFRNIFLMTFRTFTTADRLFEMLVDRFLMDKIDSTSDVEIEDWRKKWLYPTQRRVFTIFTMWLEDHRLLEEEPHLARRMTNFLTLVAVPSSHALAAKLIIQAIERLTFATPIVSPPISSRKWRKSRPHKNDLLRLDPTDIAEQLSLLEHNLYTKISPQECLAYAKTSSGNLVANLCAFCGTHDKLSTWVKLSILNNEVLSKRADTIDFWIKVAEKCRNLNNFASMSALLTALSSTVITRLHQTWVHVGRKSNLDALLRHNDPLGRFSGYRDLLNNTEGSCVPFIGMFLTDIVHIRDRFHDEDEQICFLQRQKWYEVVTAMLRYQPRHYNIADNEPTRNFISGHLRAASSIDQNWFWTRSKEVQQTEEPPGDLRNAYDPTSF